MFVVFSHILAFSALFVASISDLYTTDVPDIFGVVGIAGGLSLHAAQAFVTGSFDPLFWSLGVGAVFSLYGWGLYLLGMWGGADAFAMSVLGFAAPYSLSGPGYLHSVNLFVNIMLLGFLYSVLFAVYRASRSGGVFRKTLKRLNVQEKRISLEVLFAGLIAAVMEFVGLPGLVYFVSLVVLIFLFRFFRVLEQESMSEKVEISELEPGAVIDLEQIDIGLAREKNSLGKFLESFRDRLEDIGLGKLGSGLEGIERRVGFPEVVGVEKEEIKKLRDSGVETVEVKTGVRFVPVFPVALALTDISGMGILLLISIF